MRNVSTEKMQDELEDMVTQGIFEMSFENDEGDYLPIPYEDCKEISRKVVNMFIRYLWDREE